MSSKTHFFELFENTTGHSNFFLRPINQNSGSMQIIFEGSSGTILGVRNIVTITSNLRVIVQIDFHKGYFIIKQQSVKDTYN